VARAQRFSIAVRLLWRRREDPDWVETVTENASRSGILFRSDHLLAIGTEVELILALSWETAPAVEMADVMCSGRIVRAATTYGDKPVTMMAATIDSYSFIGEADLRDDSA
jgi:hypothetical protein